MIQNLAAASSGNLPLNQDEAEKYCEKLARNHYENFTVGSLFIPGKLRRHMYNIYAFCRWSDDLGDETGDPRRSLELLEDWEQQLDACFQGKNTHPIFTALRRTITEFNIPKEPFWQLIQAFKQDQKKNRYSTFQEVLDYCQYSANPVGRLVLYLFGYRDEERRNLSDYTCTALQLANFWQDVKRDLKIGRIYIPLEDLERFDVKEKELFQNTAASNFKRLMAFQVERTREIFEQGFPLAHRVNGLLKIELEAFSRGGLAVLEGIKKVDYDVLNKRPVVSRWSKLKILFRAVFGLAFGDR